MFSKLKSLVLAGVVLVGAAVGTVAVAAEFNDGQRKEIGEIVREYLLQNPSVLREAFQALERQERLARQKQSKETIKSLAADIFRADGDLVAGNPKGKTTIVEFFDYNCGFCKRSLPDVLKLIETDKDLKVVIKEFPILGEGSVFAARAAIAAREQGKYWEFHLAMAKRRSSVDATAVLQIAKKIGLDLDKLKADMKSDKVAAIIQRNLAIAQALNINGTPAFIVGDKILPGAVGFRQIAGTIDAVRKEGGCGFC